MSTRKTTRILLGSVVAIAGAAALPAQASLLTWDVTPGGTSFANGTYANWTPGGGANLNNSAAPTTGTFDDIGYTIWDGFGVRGITADTGGQKFDVKAMYATVDSTYLHVGIITGFNPAGVTRLGDSYILGDLAIDPNFAANTALFGLKTITAPATVGGNSGTGLKLYSGGTWTTPGVDGWYTAPFSNLTTLGTLVGSDSTYTYTDLGITYENPADGNTLQDTYLLEYNVPIAELGLGNVPITVSFAPSCSNDAMQVTAPPGTGSKIPEPASLGLLVLGVTGMLLHRRTRA